MTSSPSEALALNEEVPASVIDPSGFRMPENYHQSEAQTQQIPDPTGDGDVLVRIASDPAFHEGLTQNTPVPLVGASSTIEETRLKAHKAKREVA